MRTTLPLCGLLLCLLMIGCAPRPTEAPPAAFAGFDTWRYPGAETMRAWREASPYEWVGYYLPSPCHRGTSWVGKRQEIEGMGFGTAVLYVGQQTWDNVPEPEEEPERIICARTLLTEEEGRRNGRDAVQKMASEGFPAGSVVFLNVERMEQTPPAMLTYYRAWMEEVLEDGRFVPGTYVHLRNANDLFGPARTAFLAAERTELPPFWIAGGSGFTLDALPQAIGLPFAEIWQGVLDVEREWGGVTLQIDENVSTRRSPSAPAARGLAGPVRR